VGVLTADGLGSADGADDADALGDGCGGCVQEHVGTGAGVGIGGFGAFDRGVPEPGVDLAGTGEDTGAFDGWMSCVTPCGDGEAAGAGAACAGRPAGARPGSSRACNPATIARTPPAARATRTRPAAARTRRCRARPGRSGRTGEPDRLRRRSYRSERQAPATSRLIARTVFTLIVLRWGQRSAPAAGVTAAVRLCTGE
jgi:hypothetical protein